MPRDEIMAWCYIAIMSLAIAGALTYKWTRPPCHTALSRGGPFCEQMFAIKYITLLRLPAPPNEGHARLSAAGPAKIVM
jgi:hypothetical protein